MSDNKIGVVKDISAIKVGEKDTHGNKIISVLATNNEYAIYEIDHSDINNKIKVLVSGHTDESEREICEKFNKVKQKYIEAKGLLSRAKNYGMMKQRVAHTLSTCLSSDDVEGVKEFDLLIDTIKKEHGTLVWHRTVYLLPCIIAVIILFLASIFIFMAMLPDNKMWSVLWLVSTSLLAATLGGCLSMLITAKSLSFDEFSSSNYYLVLGLERLVLSCMAGAIAFIAIKSEIAFTTFANANHWGFMSVLVLSGFSESFIPSILGKIKNKDNEKNT